MFEVRAPQNVGESNGQNPVEVVTLGKNQSLHRRHNLSRFFHSLDSTEEIETEGPNEDVKNVVSLFSQEDEIIIIESDGEMDFSLSQSQEQNCEDLQIKKEIVDTTPCANDDEGNEWHGT